MGVTFARFTDVVVNQLALVCTNRGGTRFVNVVDTNYYKEILIKVVERHGNE